MIPAGIKEQRIKRVKQLIKEQRKLYNSRRWEELPKPEPHGWWKEHCLRENVSKRKDAWIYQMALKQASTPVWGRHKQMADHRWHRQSNRYYGYGTPGIKPITHSLYQELPLKVKILFTPQYYLSSKGDNWHVTYELHLSERWFTTRYRRAYATHVYVLDNVLEQQIAEIDAELEKAELYATEVKVRSHRWYMFNKWTRKNLNRKARKANKDLLTTCVNTGDLEILETSEWRINSF